MMAKSDPSPSTRKRIRRPNFTSHELDALVTAVEARPQLASGKLGGVYQTISAQRSAWEEVCSQVNTVKIIIRNTREIREKWADMKTRAKSKAAKLLEETQAEDLPLQQLTPLEERIMRLVDERSVQIHHTGVQTRQMTNASNNVEQLQLSNTRLPSSTAFSTTHSKHANGPTANSPGISVSPVVHENSLETMLLHIPVSPQSPSPSSKEDKCKNEQDIQQQPTITHQDIDTNHQILVNQQLLLSTQQQMACLIAEYIEESRQRRAIEAETCGLLRMLVALMEARRMEGERNENENTQFTD